MPEKNVDQTDHWWRSEDERIGLPVESSEAGQLSFGPVEISRRQALRLLAASAATSALAACDSPPLAEAPVATTINPNDVTFYATTLTFAGVGIPVIATIKDNRPIKLDGNGNHPVGVSGSDVLTQAATLSLYDPQRANTVTHNGQAASWDLAYSAMEGIAAELDDDGGESLAVLLGPTTSSSLSGLIDSAKSRWPNARWHMWDPLAPVANGTTPLRPLYDLKNAQAIVSLNNDLFGLAPASSHNISGFSSGRRTRADMTDLTTLFVAEPAMTLTGAAADQRLPLHGSGIPALIYRIAGLLGITGASDPLPNAEEESFAEAASSALRDAGSNGLLTVGPHEPEETQLLAAAINSSVGSLGSSVKYVPTGQIIDETETSSLPAFLDDLNNGRTKTAMVLGCNPAYDAPAGWDVGSALSKAETSFFLGHYSNETAAACSWQLPETHDLESWGDLRALDGTISLRQPLIQPLFNGRSQIEVLAMLLGESEPDGLALVLRHIGSGSAGTARPGPSGTIGNEDAQSSGSDTAQPPLSSLQQLFGAQTYSDEDQLASDVENVDDPPPTNEPASRPENTAPSADAVVQAQWREALSQGFVAGTAFASSTPSMLVPTSAPATQDVVSTLYLRPDPSIFDGAYAESAWLQETPKPLTKLTWTNALEISASDAEANGLSDGDLVTLTVADQTLSVPILISPGMVAGSMRLDLGYGRTQGGVIATGLGVNGFALRGASSGFALSPVAIASTGKTVTLPTTQTHHSMEGRGIVRQMTLTELASSASSEPDLDDARLYDLVPGGSLKGQPAWGMVIDQSACVGCNACVTACQSENNVAVVGEEEIVRGRTMHWLRIDRYFGGEAENPDVFFQPVNCMHCEVAPCEAVCPVGASIHDQTGLNVQVYNRCVGTRFCEANCPYQVRRFNFLHYSEIELDKTGDMAIAQAVRNPDVTVRSRGIMEKCTYCVQRLKAWDIEQQVTGEDQATPETACQQACPAQAITFGDLRDEDSPVAKLRNEPHHYALLAERGTRPRTTYLARVRAGSEEASS